MLWWLHWLGFVFLFWLYLLFCWFGIVWVVRLWLWILVLWFVVFTLLVLTYWFCFISFYWCFVLDTSWYSFCLKFVGLIGCLQLTIVLCLVIDSVELYAFGLGFVIYVRFTGLFEWNYFIVLVVVNLCLSLRVMLFDLWFYVWLFILIVWFYLVGWVVWFRCCSVVFMFSFVLFLCLIIWFWVGVIWVTLFTFLYGFVVCLLI